MLRGGARQALQRLCRPAASAQRWLSVSRRVGSPETPGLVEQLVFHARDPVATADFYVTALDLRVQGGGVGEAKLLGAGNSCALSFLPEETLTEDFLTPVSPAVSFPLATVATSNLRRSCRFAPKKGGAVLEGPVASLPGWSAPTPSRDASEAEAGDELADSASSSSSSSSSSSAEDEGRSRRPRRPKAPPGPPMQALFVDPDQRVVVGLHVFRRNPIVSVTLGVEDLGRAEDFYVHCLGMRVVRRGVALSWNGVGAKEALLEAMARAPSGSPASTDWPSPWLAEALFPPELPVALAGRPFVSLAYGSEHNTTTLCLVGESGDSARNEGVLSLRVPDLGGAFGRITRRPEVSTSPFVEARDSDFLCTDMDGYVLRVRALDA